MDSVTSKLTFKINNLNSEHSLDTFQRKKLVRKVINSFFFRTLKIEF
jgi:hypothetical protein